MKVTLPVPLDQITALTQAGNELIPTHNHETTMKGNSGNGFAKITILEYDALQIADLSLNYLNTGNYEVIIPNVTSSLTTILGFSSFISLETLNSYKYLCLSNLKSIPSKITLSK